MVERTEHRPTSPIGADEAEFGILGEDRRRDRVVARQHGVTDGRLQAPDGAGPSVVVRQGRQPTRPVGR